MAARYLSTSPATGGLVQVAPALTGGSASAGQIVALNSQGQIDSSMLPSSSSSAATALNFSYPRDPYWRLNMLAGESNTWTNLGSVSPVYNQPSSASTCIFSGWYGHEAQSADYFQMNSPTSTGTALVLTTQYASTPAFRNLSAKMSITVSSNWGQGTFWVALFDSGLSYQTNIGTTVDLPLACGQAAVGFRLLGGVDSHWQFFMGDGLSATTFIDTGIAPIPADSQGKMPLQAFDVWMSANNDFVAAIDGAVIYSGTPANNVAGSTVLTPFGQNRGWWPTITFQNQTTASVSCGVGLLYIGSDRDH